MTLAVSEKSLVVLKYLQANADKKMTAADIAEGTGLEKKSVEGIVTSGLARKGYAQRTPAQIEVEEDGIKKYKDVKFISATKSGMEYDHQKAINADAAAKAEAASKED